MASLTNVELGRKVKEAAKDAGLTLLQLGSRLGVSRPTIYAYAAGTLRISAERLEQIAVVTGKPLTYFEPKSPEHLDNRSMTALSFKLIDALMSPASPARASEAAMRAIEEGDEPLAPGIRAELLRRSGNALAMSGDYVESIRNMEDARNLFEAAGESEKVGSTYQTLGFCYTSLGNLDQAKACFERAKDLMPSDSTWKPQVAIAALLERRGQFDDAEQHLSALLEDPDLAEVPMAYVRANFASIVCARGRWRSGLAQTETALHAAYSLGLADQVAEMLVQGSMALMNLGRLTEATLMASRSRDVTFALQDEARATLVEVCVARLLRAFGEYAAARSMAGSAFARAIRGQYRRSESYALLLLAELALDRNDNQSALESAEQSISHSRAHNFVVQEAAAQLVALRASFKLGNSAQASERLQTITDCAIRCGESQMTVVAEEALGQAALFERDTARAKNHWTFALKTAKKLGLKLDARRISENLAELLGPQDSQVQAESPQSSAQDRIWVNILKGAPIEDDHSGSEEDEGVI